MPTRPGEHHQCSDEQWHQRPPSHERRDDTVSCDTEAVEQPEQVVARTRPRSAAHPRQERCEDQHCTGERQYRQRAVMSVHASSVGHCA